MIASIIRWSAANRFLVLLGTLFIVGAGVWAVRNTPLDAIPDLSDVQVIVYTDYPGQAPQVVEDQVTYPLTTALLTVPRSKVVRGFSFFGVVLRLRRLRGRHRPLLGAQPRAGIPQPRGNAPAGGRDAIAWARTPPASAGSTSTSSPARSGRLPNCARSRTGSSATSSRQGGRRRGGRQRRRLRPAIPGRRRPAAAPGLRHPAGAKSPRRSAPATATSAAARSRCPRPSTSCAAAAICAASPIIEQIVLSKPATARRCCCSDIARVRAWPRRTARHHRTERRRRSRQRHRAAALRPERARRSSTTSRRSSRRSRRACRRAWRSRRSTTARDLIHARDRHAEAHADRGKPDRRAGLHRLPAACAQRARRDRHAAGRRADRLRPRMHAARPELQHHEPGRHRHRARRHGRRGHRHDRERAQAPGAAHARRAARSRC